MGNVKDWESGGCGVEAERSGASLSEETFLWGINGQLIST